MKAKRVTYSKVTSRYLITFMSMHCKIVYMLFESKNVIDIIRVVIPAEGTNNAAGLWYRLTQYVPLNSRGAFVFYRRSPFSLFRGGGGGWEERGGESYSGTLIFLAF